MRLDAIKRQVAHLRGSGKDSALQLTRAKKFGKRSNHRLIRYKKPASTAAKARTAAKKRGKGPEESGMGAQHYLCVRFSIGDLPTVHVVCKQTMVLDKAQSRTSPHSI